VPNSEDTNILGVRSWQVATATRTFQLPAVSCDGGPLRVYDVEGRVTRHDDDYEGRTVRVRAGDLVGPGASLVVLGGGRAVVGATECNGFRLSLGPGVYTVGTYVQSGRGAAFAGSRAAGTGDAHAGGFTAHGLTGVVRGAHDRRRAARAVSAGTVVATAFNGRAARLREGEEAAALCATRDRCRLVGPRLFQPAEPWTTFPGRSTPRFAHRLSVAPGTRPPRHLLAPPFSLLREVRDLPAAGGEPEEVLVAWSRWLRARPGPSLPQSANGITLWRRMSPTEWRVAWSRRYAEFVAPGAIVGDVNGDRHADVLLVEWNGGTGFCGPRRLLADVGGRARVLFARSTCETQMTIANGALVIDEPVGPCPYRQGSVHCFGGTRHVVLRWRGARLVARSAHVSCALPRLDPARGCRRRR
jgi:hypothetical protein